MARSIRVHAWSVFADRVHVFASFRVKHNLLFNHVTPYRVENRRKQPTLSYI